MNKQQLEIRLLESYYPQFSDPGKIEEYIEQLCGDMLQLENLPISEEDFTALELFFHPNTMGYSAFLETFRKKQKSLQFVAFQYSDIKDLRYKLYEYILDYFPQLTKTIPNCEHALKNGGINRLSQYMDTNLYDYTNGVFEVLIKDGYVTFKMYH